MGLDLSVYSRYVWRGIVYDEGAVLQPDFWIQARGITMTFWGSLDVKDENGDHLWQFNEWDTFLDVTMGGYGPVWFGGGLYYNSFPASSGEGLSTAEVAAWASGDVAGSPTIIVYWDIWALHGVYVNFNLSQDVDIGPGNLALSAGVGWGDDRHNLWSGVEDAGGWLDLQADVEYSIFVSSLLTLTPALHFSSMLQDEIRDYYDKEGIDPTSLFFSLGVSLAVSP